jgi:hypothetical protein
MGHDKRKMLARVRHKERKRLAGKCKSKARYEFAEAQLWAMQYRQKPYKCPLCGYWHLTSTKS